MMGEEQTNIDGDKVVKKDSLLIKYEGPSFNNQMELHTFSKQISSVERILNESFEQLSKNQKIKDKPDEPICYVELKKGSFETWLLIIFSNPILINIVSDFIYDYFKFLVSGIKSNKYKTEIEGLVSKKIIRNSTKDIINPCIENNDRVTIINGNVSINQPLVITRNEKEVIKDKLMQIEEEIPVENFQKEMFGKILKVDAVKTEEHLSKSKLGFVEDGLQRPVDAIFSNEISEEELKNILFKRIRVDSVLHVKGEEIIKMEINSYTLAPIRKLNSYLPKN